jgi:hypothetical protein
MEKIMLNFGTSAYLKLLALNPKPRDSEIRKRLQPSENGYDYYKAMRRIAAGYAGGATSVETAAALNAIKRSAERDDAIKAIERLKLWLNDRTIAPALNCDKHAISPSGEFSVKFQPDFEIRIEGTPTHVHIWNTQKPVPRLREAIGVLGLFRSDADTYRQAILSLRTGELFVAHNVESARQLASLLALDVEKRIQRILIEEPVDRRRDDRPGDAMIR